MNRDSTRALILIDLINDIVHPTGKIAAKGYADFCSRNGISTNISNVLTGMRRSTNLVVHVRVGYPTAYLGLPLGSPILGRARDFGVLQLGSWGTEFVEWATPAVEELTVTKSRVSAFYCTNLEQVLRTCNVQELLIAGVATDLAIESTARDGHDRDFSIVVLKDCCIAASEEDHKNALNTMLKFGKVVDSSEI